MSRDFWKNKKILITGGKGFVGSHVVDFLLQKRHVSRSQLLIPDSAKDDLRNFRQASRVVKGIDIILHLAADVGGIAYSSSHPATQMRNCLQIDLNVLEAAVQEKAEKLVCVSSAVAYPETAKSPLKEIDLFQGEPAKGGYGYGFAKRMVVILSRAYHEEKGLNVSVLLAANAYGPGDDFDPETSHVIPSLIRKCLTERKLVVWGDGSQIRDFLYVKDFAEAVVLSAERLKICQPVNIGSGEQISIRDLVNFIVRLTGFKGKITWDINKPKGQPRRLVEIAKAKKLLGFKPRYSLEAGLKETIEWYKNYGQQ